jgi:hypothetical protein
VAPPEIRVTISVRWLVGNSVLFLAAQAFLVVAPTVLAFPCIVIGLLGSPLCGAALTFFAAAKKVSKESGLTPLALSEPSRSATGNGLRQDLLSHIPTQ